MSALTAASRGRSLAERQMTSTCRIFTPSAPITDPDSGEVTYAEQGAVDTVCRVRPNSRTSGNDGDVGGAEIVASGYVVSVPFAVTPAFLQRLVITASPDPSLVGLSLEIRQVARGDNITARRLLCEEVA